MWNRLKSILLFHSISRVLWYSIEDISGLRGWILQAFWKPYQLYFINWNFWNFIAKFGFKAEICWKLEESKWNLLNNSEVSSYLLGPKLLFWKVSMQAFQKELLQLVQASYCAKTSTQNRISRITLKFQVFCWDDTILLFWKVTMQTFQKIPYFEWIFCLKKILVEGCGLREMPREFGPWIFLVPSISMKILFLDSVRAKLLESGVLSWIRHNF